MEFKRCIRCGSFFSASNDVCTNCEPKDKLDIYKLKNYFEENESTVSINFISGATGISAKNLNRYLITEEFSNIKMQLGE